MRATTRTTATKARRQIARIALALLAGAPGTQAMEPLGAAAAASLGVGEMIPLEASGAGSLLINATLGGFREAFLLDTGAAMLTLSEPLYRKLRAAGLAHREREVAARLADGRLHKVPVFLVDRVELSDRCVIENVEAMVLPGEGRNLLGLNALLSFSPFTLHREPARLSLSGCAASAVAVTSRHHVAGQ